MHDSASSMHHASQVSHLGWPYPYFISKQCSALKCAAENAAHVGFPVILQILTPQQAAVGMIAAYPTLLNHHILEDLAIAEGEPALPDLINKSHLSRTALTPSHVTLYLQKITSTSMLTHIPLLAGL